MRTALLTFLLASLFITTLFAQPGPTPERANPVEGVVLVKLSPEAVESPPQTLRPEDLQGPELGLLQRLLRSRQGRKLFRDFTPADTLAQHRQTGEPVRLIDLSRWYRIPVRDTTNVESLAARLRELPVVLKATPDYNASLDRRSSESSSAPPRTEPDDPRFPDQWGYDDSDDHDVDAPEAWSINTGRSDVTVAVVDAGVDYDHPDLDPGDRSRVIQGYDFGEDDGDPDDDLPIENGGAHGTRTAGTVGARTNNGEGVAGMMWNLKIMPLKVLDSSGDFSFSTVAEAFDYARGNGADIINASKSGTFPTNPLVEATANAYTVGMIIVGAAGTHGVDHNDEKDYVRYPAALYTTIGVGATKPNDDRQATSQYGPKLDLAAPAGFVTTSQDGSYYSFGGTSQAAPMVSGTAGLLFAESRDEGLNLSNNDVVHLLERTAEDVNVDDNPGFDKFIGHGRVNAYEALKALQPPNEVSHGSASFTKIYDDDKVDFLNGFTKENGTSYAAGPYICDICELSASASSPDFYYEETPWFWLPVTEKGFSAANPNDGSRYLDKSVSKSSAQATTYFYYVETNVNGKEIGWVPFDPTVHERNGSFEYTVIGRPDTPPVQVDISGPSSLDSGEEGTWTADVSYGEAPYGYQWYEKYEDDTSFSPISGATSQSYTDSYPGNITLKVEVTAANSSDDDTHAVTVNCDFGCVKSTAGNMLARFEVTRTGNEATMLNWQTTGAPPDRFDIQRSSASKEPNEWTTVGFVESSAETDGEYQFTDRELPYVADTLHYRLRLVDSEGVASASDPIAVVRDNVSAVQLKETYPNPAGEQVTVRYAVPEDATGDVRLTLYDAMGRAVRTVQAGPVQGRHRVQLDVGGLSSGVYLLRLRAGGTVKSRRLTVVR